MDVCQPELCLQREGRHVIRRNEAVRQPAALQMAPDERRLQRLRAAAAAKLRHDLEHKADIAEEIARRKDVRFVMIASPSSSG